MTKSGISAKIDWNRMLGFEQISEARESVRDDSARLAAKVGNKVGEKVGLKLGQKVGTKLGVKAGFKA
jgi:hypothetical protein